MRVYNERQRRNGDTIEFIVSDCSNKIYSITNCHRIESPFWSSHKIKCYFGNISDGINIKCGVLRIRFDGICSLVLKN